MASGYAYDTAIYLRCLQEKYGANFRETQVLGETLHQMSQWEANRRQNLPTMVLIPYRYPNYADMMY